MANVKNNASAKETKRRLIEAAGEVFAEQGFERATIKDITERAGASLAAVNYHFSDKQELYDQVVAHVHEAGQHVFAVVRDQPADATAEQRLHAFVDRFMRHVLDPSLPAWHCQLKSREMQTPTAATERFIDESIRPFARGLEGLLADIVGRNVPQQELTRLVNSVLGQCVFYAHSRVLLERLYPDQPLPSESVKELADHITRFTLAALSCWR